MSKALKLAIEKNDLQLARKAVKTVRDLNRKLLGAARPLHYACKLGATNVVDWPRKSARSAKKQTFARLFSQKQVHGRTPGTVLR